MIHKNVRPLQPSDFEAWLPLWRGYLEFYGSTQEPETTVEIFARLTGGEPTMGAFLACDAAEKAIGMTHWITHRSCWTLGDYCYLQDLFVASKQRGTGIGRALIEAVYESARQQGCSRVYWLTQATNTSAMKLYDQIATRSGFVQYVKKFNAPES